MQPTARTSPRARLRRDEDGFALLESLVAAVLLLVISLAVLASLDTAAKSSSKLRARSVASALVEQDLERMRSIAVTDLSNFHQDRQVDGNDGVPYRIISRAEWVRDTSGTQSCTSDTTQAQYLKITSTATSTLVGAEMAPVSESSLVAPPVAAFGANQGTLAVKVTGRDGVNDPIEGVTVRATGTSGSPSLNDTTNEAGCAIFGYIPAGSYNIVVDAPGYVDTASNPTATQSGFQVLAGRVSLANLTYDAAGYVNMSFEAPDALTSTLKPSRGWYGVVANSAGARVISAAAPAADPVDGFPAPAPVFPSKTAYTLFAGDCAGNDPTKLSTPIADFFTAKVPAQAPVVDRRTTVDVKLRQGSFKALVTADHPVTVSVKDSTATPSGATPACGTAGQKIGAASTWTTVADPSDPTKIYVTKAWSALLSPKAFDTGLPFGTYDICAYDAVDKKYAKQTVDIKDATSAAVAPLNVKTGTASLTGCP
jgi:Tfp pilus assembly protein PilV